MKNPFSMNLRRARAIKTWTQDGVASKIQKPRQTYQAYEDGRSSPDPETLVRLAAIFNITTVDDLAQFVINPDCSLDMIEKE